jgi:hypothetical protein
MTNPASAPRIAAKQLIGLAAELSLREINRIFGHHQVQPRSRAVYGSR